MVVTAFLLVGFEGGLTVAILNAIFLLAVYPGPSRALYPLTNTVAISAMMVGIYLANRILTHKITTQKTPSSAKTVGYYTAFSMVLRIVVMAPIMYVLMLLAGVSALAAVGTVLSMQAIYNIIMAL